MPVSDFKVFSLYLCNAEMKVIGLKHFYNIIIVPENCKSSAAKYNGFFLYLHKQQFASGVGGGGWWLEGVYRNHIVGWKVYTGITLSVCLWNFVSATPP